MNHINIFIFIFSTLLLFFNKNYFFLFFYFLFFIFNYFINIIIKLFLKHPRPKENIEIFYLYQHKLPFHEFGNPAENIQSIFFSSSFLSLSLHHHFYYFIYSIFSTFAIFIEIYRENHYYYQIIFAAFIGCSIGYFAFIISSFLLSDSLQHKDDDFSFSITNI